LDRVSTIINAPFDGIQQPEKSQPTTQRQVVAENTHALGGDAASYEKAGGKKEVGDGTEDEESPFVGRMDQGARKP
jgi:hypothetical protein